MDDRAIEIVRRAFVNGDMRKLLLEDPEYCYMYKWSSSPSNSDTSVLREIIYRYTPADIRVAVQQSYKDAIDELVSEKIGIIPVCHAILHEVGSIRDQGKGLGLDLESLATQLSKIIPENFQYLSNDKSGHGRGWANGMIGEVARVDKIVQELGGPPIIR